jgi:electron transfer flavoprotein alpha subunit
MAEKRILVFSENPYGLKELLGKAKQVAGSLSWKVMAMPWGDNALAEAQGVDELCKVAQAQKYISDSQAGAEALSAAIKTYQPGVVLFGATKIGMDVAARVADRMQIGYSTWIVDFSIAESSSSVTAKGVMFSGNAIATYEFKSGVALLGTAPGVYDAIDLGSSAPVVYDLAVEFGAPALTVLEMKEKAATGARLEEAKFVVDVGQGVKEKSDLDSVRELAGMLDGQIACSRPIASDRDWFPEWLGLSGKKIKPELCLTLGISGSIQHIVGIRESRLIASVNNDENAGIFSQADYGIIGDLYEFLPAFKERLQARGVKPAWE